MYADYQREWQLIERAEWDTFLHQIMTCDETLVTYFIQKPNTSAVNNTRTVPHS